MNVCFIFFIGTGHSVCNKIYIMAPFFVVNVSWKMFYSVILWFFPHFLLYLHLSSECHSKTFWNWLQPIWYTVIILFFIPKRPYYRIILWCAYTDPLRSSQVLLHLVNSIPVPLGYHFWKLSNVVTLYDELFLYISTHFQTTTVFIHFLFNFLFEDCAFTEMKQNRLKFP